MNAAFCRTIAGAALLFAMSGPWALARAQVQHEPVAGDVIRQVQQFYRNNDVCERVGVQVKTPGVGSAAGGGGGRTGLPRVNRATYLLRFRAQPGVGQPPVASLELGQYLLDASEGFVTVAHARNPTIMCRRPLGGVFSSSLLATIVPPVPLPQVDLALASDGAGDGTCSEFWPYASGISWRTVEVEPRFPARRMVRGDFPGGTVSLATSGPRLRLITIERNEPRVTISLAFTPISQCEPGKPLIDADRRTLVGSLLELRPRGGAVRVGEALPEVQLSPAGGGEWSVGELIESPPEAVIVGIPPAEHAVLVFSRVLPPAAIPRLARMDFDTLGQLLRSTRSAAFQPARTLSGAVEPVDQPARFGYARVLVFNGPAPDEVLAQVTAAGQAWGLRNVLWASSPANSLDLLAPSADAVVVIVDSSRVVRSVIPIEPSSSADQVADQITGALFELGAPRGMATFVPPSGERPFIDAPLKEPPKP